MEIAYLLFFLLGALAGSFGSLLGIGGGLILIPALDHFTDLTMHQIICLSLSSIVVNSIVITAQRVKSGMVDVRLASKIEPLCLLGGMTSGFFAQSLPAEVLARVFALFCFFLGCFYFWQWSKGIRASKQENGQARGFEEVTVAFGDLPFAKRAGVYSLAGAGSAFAALIGIGGGALIVPLLNLIGKIPLKAATGTSLYVIGTTSTGALIPYMLNGNMPYLHATMVSGGVLLGVSVVNRFLTRIKASWITVMFAALLIVVGVKMWLK